MIPDVLTLLFWVQLPVAVARVSPTAASVLMDGVYLVRGTLVGGGAPLLAVLLGVLAGARHSGATFVASLLVMGVLGAIGMLGAHLGLLSTLGYVIGDLVIRDRARSGPQDSVALLFSYALLALLTVYLPLVVGAARLWARKAYKRGNLPLWIEMVAAVVVAAVGVSAWSLALRVLIRPAYGWQGIARTTLDLDLAASTRRWWVLPVAVAIAAALRVRREHTGRGHIVGSHVTEVRSALERRTKRVAKQGLSLPEPTFIGGGAMLLTILVAGLIDGIAQGVIVLVFFAALLWGRTRLTEAVGTQGVARTPALLRGAVAAVVGYGASALLLATAGGSWAELFGTCLTIALVVLATAQPAARPRTHDAEAGP